ncbi:MAG: GumC family protein [Desulfobacteraceae bacterium]|nr:GumC family protein [Desulfobacteraceae bacterium]
MMNNQELEQSVHLADYFYILIKRRWLITFSFVFIVGLTLLYTLQMKPVYQAASTMVIDKEQSTSPLTGERMDYDSFVSQNLTFNTHFKLITSRPVLEMVIRNLKLDQLGRGENLKEGPVNAFLLQIKKNIRMLMGKEEKILTPADERAALITKLKENIVIREIRDTRLLKIYAEDYEPAIARDIANGLASAYIDFNTASRLKSSKNTLNWMTTELYETKKKLEDAEKEFLAYKRNEKIFSITGKQKVISQQIAEFNDAYLETRNKRLELDSKLAKLRQIFRAGKIIQIRSLVDNPLIDNLYSQLLELEVELNRLSNIFKPKHPKIVQLTSKMEKTRRKLDEELKKEMESLKAQRSVFLSKERVLKKTTADFEKDALETNEKELQYIILQRNVDTHKKLHDTLFSKIKESNIEENLDVSNIRIVEDAVIPIAPVKPKKKLNLILSAILGMMIGVGFSFLLEYLDRSVYTEEDVQKYLGVPVLSVIPEAELP